MNIRKQRVGANSHGDKRSPDPNDDKSKQSTEQDRNREKDSEVLKKPRRFSQKDVQKKWPPHPDPDDPVSR